MPISSLPLELQIESLKITGYLLNLRSTRGAPKARYFMSYGFDPARPQELAEALFDHARSARLVSRNVTPYGTILVFRAIAETPNKKIASDIKSVWEIKLDATYCRLVTAYRA